MFFIYTVHVGKNTKHNDMPHRINVFKNTVLTYMVIKFFEPQLPYLEGIFQKMAPL